MLGIDAESHHSSNDHDDDDDDDGSMGVDNDNDNNPNQLPAYVVNDGLLGKMIEGYALYHRIVDNDYYYNDENQVSQETSKTLTNKDEQSSSGLFFQQKSKLEDLAAVSIMYIS